MKTKKILIILTGIILTVIGFWIIATWYFFGSNINIGTIGGT